MSKIVWPRGSIVLTPEDLLWAGRAAAREASAGLGWTAVLWSWAQRAAWLGDRGRGVACRGQSGMLPLTYTNVVRCHSQPVNPYWINRGTAAQIRVRSYLQSPAATWEGLERGSGPMQPKPGLKAHVYRWAAGELPNPVDRLADFSAPGMSDVPRGAPVIGGNAFFPETETRSWPANYVHIEGTPGTSGGGAASGNGPGLLTGLLIALGVFTIGYLAFKD